MRILDRFRLDGRVAVLTGASAGLGVAMAVALAEAGVDLVLGARRTEALETTAALVAARVRRAVCSPTDVTNPDACAALCRVEQFRHVDVLVNDAGVTAIAPASREAPEQFRAVVETNLMCTYPA